MPKEATRGGDAKWVLEHPAVVLSSPASARQSRRQVMLKVQDLTSHAGEFVTVSELARYWHVSERTIYRHILKGALPAVRIGPFGRLRLRTRDALNYGRPDDRG